MIGWRITRFRLGGEREELDDRVVVELPLEIYVNEAPLVALMRTPGMDKELALGFCITEGVIKGMGQVRLIRHCGEMEEAAGRGEEAGEDGLDRGNVVRLEVEEPGERERFKATYLVRTGCGGADLRALEDVEEGAVDSRLLVREEVIYGIGGELTARQEVFRATGGTHGAGVFDPGGKALVVAEDVGRHNALDKVVGWCAMRGIDLADKLLALSGRLSYEMVLKAARAGFPVVVSLAAPTSLGLRLAEKAGVTLIGFSDGKRFNVYTHRWRVAP